MDDRATRAARVSSPRVRIQAMKDSADSERRLVGRTPFVTDVEVTGLTMVRSTDLSIGGIYLEAITGFPEGTRLELRFKLEPTDEHPIEVRCRVLYSHESIGFGLAFEDLSAEDTRRIDGYIAARAT